jgi:hypothetical protein
VQLHPENKKGIAMRFTGILLLCVCMTAAFADQVYRWVDADGHVHYSQSPPPGATTNAKKVDVTTKPADSAAVQYSQDLQQQQFDASQRAQADAARRGNAHPVTYCDMLRQQQEQVRGNRKMTDIDRDRAAQRIQDRIDAQCH